MRAVILAALAVGLSACAALSINDHAAANRALEHNGMIEDITDRILVVNILRARDRAPLHFGEIPLIHESYQVNGGLTPTFLFGPAHAGSGSNLAAATIALQEAPSFDMNNLDTQEFITGIMSPINPRVVKYWLDRGMDDRLSLLLFFSKVKITIGKESITILNNPRGTLLPNDSDLKDLESGKKGLITKAGIPVTADTVAADTVAADTATIRYYREWPFFAYLSVINRIPLGQFKFVEVPDLSPVGGPFKLDTEQHLKELLGMDPDKYVINPVKIATTTKEGAAPDAKPGLYQLFEVSDTQLVICAGSQMIARMGKQRRRLDDPGSSPCKDVRDNEILSDLPESHAKAQGQQDKSRACASLKQFLTNESCTIDDAAASLSFSLRSAGDVVHFLGDLQALQDNMPRSLNSNDPVTLGYCEDKKTCFDGGTLFNVGKEKKGAPGRLRVPYRDDFYTVPDSSDADHTLEVLEIASQLINLNKSATELRSTPTVQVVP